MKDVCHEDISNHAPARAFGLHHNPGLEIMASCRLNVVIGSQDSFLDDVLTRVAFFEFELTSSDITNFTVQ